MEMIQEDTVFCDVCKKNIVQLLVEEFKDLAIKSRGSLFQKFQCGKCKQFNERMLQFCWKCGKHTEQKLINEQPSETTTETINQEFRCDVCQTTNDTTRDSDEHTQRWINGKNEEHGIYCNHCMYNKKQYLIDKHPSSQVMNFSEVKFDLTTYKCKTCGTINYGTEQKLDIR